MKAFRTRLTLVRSDDAGLTLIEVLVAMFIFGLISIGIAFSLTSSLVMTRDASARETAANLAASDIDSVRAAADAFTVADVPTLPATKPPAIKINGTNFYVWRTTNWVTSTSATAQCGADGSGATLQYKRVNVRVTWDGMRATTPAVEADTLLAPSGRINDPTLGTILVRVLNIAGSGTPNVAVTASASSVTPNTAQPLKVTPAATDAQGCSYILKVTPGTYDVTINKANYISDDEQLTSATKYSVSVSAGAAATAGFQFDQAVSFPVTYASNYTATPAAVIPTNMDTTYANTYLNYVAKSSNNPIMLHPYTAGYDIFAGKFADPVTPTKFCNSVDPEKWPSKTISGSTWVGQRGDTQAADPGESLPTPASVAMGVAVITLKSTSGTYLNAVSQATAPGTDDPGCALPVTYTWGSVLSTNTTRTIVVALPFGSWKFYSGSNATSTTNTIAAASITLKTVGPNGPTIPTSNIVTFDPRVVVS